MPPPTSSLSEAYNMYKQRCNAGSICSMNSFEYIKQLPHIVAVLQIRLILCTLS